MIHDNRGTIPNRTNISQRPPEVELRERFGDLEIDLIIGKDHKGAVLTINDRATGIAKLRKLNGKDAEQLALAAIDCLKDWKPFLKTITSDNGKEFAGHQMVAKDLNIDYVTHDYVNYVEQQLNNRPRKRYGYLSPNQIFSQVWNTHEKSG